MTRKPMVYIAAPYTANPVTNTRLAIEAGLELWAIGTVAVIIPHLTLLADLVHPMPLAEWYAFDQDLLAHCDAVFLAGAPSPGVQAELSAAAAHNLPVFDATWELLRWADGFASPPAANGAIHQPPGETAAETTG